ncbi:MAG: hypothetical protein WBQ75_04570 [Acetobacteraceae bacterium]
MPTIDQLAPATAASDTDALVSSQSGIARKVTRAQLVAGLQPELALSSGALLGRSSPGSGPPEDLEVGANLVLSGGTLSATGAPFQVAQLPAGVVPSAGDMIPLAQNGTNVAVSYVQFANGLGGISGIDASAMTVSVAGSSEKLSDFAAASLSKAGGALIGPLVLAADPATPLQAATKQYVDAQTGTALPTTGGTLTGPLVGAAASFSGPLSTMGSLQCGGTLTAAGAIVGLSAALSGTLTVGGSVQLGTATIKGSVAATGTVSAAGGFVGSTLGVTGGITAGGQLAVLGPFLAQGGATIMGGAVIMPQYTVASLPPASAGAVAYATNGRKSGEAPGAGSGLLVWGTATNQWISTLTGTPVQA